MDILPGDWQLTSNDDDLVEDSAFLENADSRKKAQVTTFFVDESFISTVFQDSCVIYLIKVFMFLVTPGI